MDENEKNYVAAMSDLISGVRVDSVLIAQELFASLLPKSPEDRSATLEEVRQRAKIQTEEGSEVVGTILGMIADRFDKG